jgi:hypothetical protein
MHASLYAATHTVKFWSEFQAAGSFKHRTSWIALRRKWICSMNVTCLSNLICMNCDWSMQRFSKSIRIAQNANKCKVATCEKPFDNTNLLILRSISVTADPYIMSQSEFEKMTILHAKHNIQMATLNFGASCVHSSLSSNSSMNYLSRKIENSSTLKIHWNSIFREFHI